MNKIELNVKGMMCGGCENRVKNKLGEIQGVEDVMANHETGKVSVKCSSSVAKEILEEAIEDLGFEIV